jgi:hypothetical protein
VKSTFNSINEKLFVSILCFLKSLSSTVDIIGFGIVEGSRSRYESFNASSRTKETLLDGVFDMLGSVESEVRFFDDNSHAKSIGGESKNSKI